MSLNIGTDCISFAGSDQHIYMSNVTINSEKEFLDYLSQHFDEIKEKAEDLKALQENYALQERKARNRELRNLIKDVRWNRYACIVYWKDGTKTKALWDPCEDFDPEKAILVCIARKMYKDTGLYNEVLEKYSMAGWEEYEKMEAERDEVLKQTDYYWYCRNFDLYPRDEDE